MHSLRFNDNVTHRLVLLKDFLGAVSMMNILTEKGTENYCLAQSICTSGKKPTPEIFLLYIDGTTKAKWL